jgi:hypothetical protein
MRVRFLPIALLIPLIPLGEAQASIAGVCPDGSAFVVQRKADIPCKEAKLVDPSDIPPLRPELLPRPYPWLVDQQARNPNNPYNLVDTAEKIRELREASQAPTTTAPDGATQPEPAVAPTSAGPALAPRDIEALVEVVELRQEMAPAEILAEDALGNGRMGVRFAYSAAFEQHVLGWLGRTPAESLVLLFSVRAIEPGEFYPNFFFLQDGQGFRPDVRDGNEVGFLLGDPGTLDRGAARLGYVVVPGRFAPERPMELWWNDRRVEATLQPGS